MLAGPTAELPPSYVEFMLLAGHGVDGYLVGSDFTLGQLEGARGSAEDLLRESGLPPLPSRAFVFSMHQGYQFYYFLDEAVYYYAESRANVEKRFNSFEEFFESATRG
jgi:hypothetical protein